QFQLAGGGARLGHGDGHQGEADLRTGLDGEHAKGVPAAEGQDQEKDERGDGAAYRPGGQLEAHGTDGMMSWPSRRKAAAWATTCSPACSPASISTCPSWRSPGWMRRQMACRCSLTTMTPARPALSMTRQAAGTVTDRSRLGSSSTACTNCPACIRGMESGRAIRTLP